MFRIRLRASSEGIFPVVLHTGGQFLKTGKKSCHLPHLIRGQDILPCRHGGVSNAGADDIKNLPLGIIHRLEHNLRRWRVKPVFERARLILQRSMITSKQAATIAAAKYGCLDANQIRKTTKASSTILSTELETGSGEGVTAARAAIFPPCTHKGKRPR